MSKETSQGNTRSVSTWWIASRPFSFPASAIPVIFGTATAVVIAGAPFRPAAFAAALVGMLLLHAGSNVLSDVHDYWKGLDKEVLPVSGAVVRGLVTPEQATKGAAVMLGLGCTIGVVLAALVTPKILLIGLAGVLIGVTYTWGPFPLKYRGWGDLAVLLSFGLLGSLGAWVVQTREFSATPVLWAIPVALQVVGILHANNWRDMGSDSTKACVTLAGTLGDKGSERYYLFLVLFPYVFILFTVALGFVADITPKMPLSSLITFLSLPLALRLAARARRRHEASQDPLQFVTLDAGTAQLSMAFGVLYIASFLMAPLIG